LHFLASRLGNARKRRGRDARLVGRITGGFGHGCVVLYDKSVGDEFAGRVDLVSKAEAFPRLGTRWQVSIGFRRSKGLSVDVVPARAEAIVIPPP
jgi:hypothetical protein